ncbi:MAG: alpha/beta hydrolase [Alphaproteobacteria bacterium]|nr:alpha/beta hydrolase [Alphaproteobacteria bacterium]MEC7516320.1 alpha/beta hydrolase [Pseudomonadota bacterium]MEC8006536.1 alpha/beta hydrolase [Pseudomonadota bacterium]MEC8026749.1 alpha/beta hydrolase [Pseudomonadota bacterium]MEC8117562.1 alpha/beta hydrolase [Pseudomonadota bacterium]|tara:strand:+ start:449 stop:1333 length:885 start_codon:yes stop_codon:yes gene_type:complete
MSHITTDDGVRLYVEQSGEGTPIIFVHEFAGDHRSWEPQVRYFSRRYRCVTYSARGYDPSDVPSDVEAYSQDRARDDIRAVMDALDIETAHVVGLSMGGFATLHFGLHYPERALSLVVAGCGYGAEPDARAQFKSEAETMADRILAEGMAAVGAGYAEGPTRVQFQNKDLRGWTEFRDQLCEHSTEGSSLTMRGYQARRPSLYDLGEAMTGLTVPTLIVNGDEDEPCLEVGLFMKRQIPAAGLLIMPKTGHTMNLEEPAAFNTSLDEFFHQVEAGRWDLRDARSKSTAILQQDK